MHPPILKAAETDTSLIHLHHDGVLELRFKRGARETAESAWANIRTIHGMILSPDAADVPEVLRLYPHPLLLDLRGIQSVDPLARLCYLSAPANAVKSALALIVDSPVSTLFGNFFLTNNRRHGPVRMFHSMYPAKSWVAQFTTAHDAIPAPAALERLAWAG